MKNIAEICDELGVTIPEDKADDFAKLVNENYKTIAEFEKKVARLESERDAVKEQLETAENALKGFEGIDPEQLTAQIEEYKAKAEEAKAEYESKIADRDFSDLLKDAITSAKGLNNKAIMALLDVETLKASHNQKADIESALEQLKVAENSKMLFGLEKSEQEAPKVQFTTSLNNVNKIDTTTWSGMSLDERIKLKHDNPDLYNSLRKEA